MRGRRQEEYNSLKQFLKKKNKTLLIKIFVLQIVCLSVSIDTAIAQKGLQLEANKIDNSECLKSFVNKLDNLKRDHKGKLHILHIGDSHIQADFFSGKLRDYFQKEYGNAGIGFCFPYNLVKTNGRKAVHFDSNIFWSRKRNSLMRPRQATGIAAHSIETNTPYFELTISPLDKMQWDYNRLLIFKNPNQLAPVVGVLGSSKPKYTTHKIQTTQKVYHKVKSGDVLGKLAYKYHVKVKDIQYWNRLRGTMIRVGQKLVVKNGQYPDYAKRVTPSSLQTIQPYKSDNDAGYYAYHLQQLNPKLYIHSDKLATKDKWTFTGFYLDNELANGIVYSTIGSNGAQFNDYLKSEHFFKQLGCVKTDLVVVSMGTNESLNYPFKQADIESYIDEFISKLKLATGCSAIILTTPQDVMKGRGSRRRYNPNVNTICQLLHKAAQKHQLALWDFNKVMGGYKSVANWRAAHLGQADRIHFTIAGYEKQADLFWQAIQNNL